MSLFSIGMEMKSSVLAEMMQVKKEKKSEEEDKNVVLS